MVEVGFLGVQQGLAQSNHGRGDHHLISHLSVLTSARLAHVLNLERVDVHDIADRGNTFLSATSHDNQFAIFGADVTTRDGCIN